MVASLKNESFEKELQNHINTLSKHSEKWARSSIETRLRIIKEIRSKLDGVAFDWVKKACEKKEIPVMSPLEGEEWISGPYAVMAALNGISETLSNMKNKNFLKSIPVRKTITENISAKIVPNSIWDHLLLSGVSAEVWMQKSVNFENLKEYTASAYDIPRDNREGKISLVLGAGNIAAITPLDCFQKLFSEHKVVLLKLSPVNEYLEPFLLEALEPLINFGALKIIKGDKDVGQKLCNHPKIDDIHITGSRSTYNSVVWGSEKEAKKNIPLGKKFNKRPVSAELGAVCPTIIVPGPWSKSDIKFQAAQVATMKLHNAGFNCVACQVLIIPSNWALSDKFLKATGDAIISAPSRGLYYPGAASRLKEFRNKGKNILTFQRKDSDPCFIEALGKEGDSWFENNEIFAPAMSTFKIDFVSPEEYLKSAVDYSNEKLEGTLGANIIIHPKTIREIGEIKFEKIISKLKYGTIAINAWTGLGFLMPQCPWGAFPGHKPDDIQSGTGFVHNTYMFDKVERCVVRAPFRPFPRNLFSFKFTLLPKPPWFVNNTRQKIIGRLLTRFQYKPSILKLPRIFLNALIG